MKDTADHFAENAESGSEMQMRKTAQQQDARPFHWHEILIA
ncbi:hypothetical protein [Andreprevotia chitinilytica]|nr:hypothetical protein [Andreprevotia chitinilytica]